MRTLAAAPVVTGLSTDADVSTFLNRALAENTDWEGVAIVNGEGSTLFSTSPASPFLSIADRPYFQQVMASRRPFVSSAITGRVSGLPSVVLAAPVDFASGARGVLVVPVPTDRLHAALRSQIGTESLQVTVVDRDGSTIADRDPNRMRNLTPIRGRPDVDAALTGAIGTQRIELDGADTLVAYAPVADNGAVLIVEAAGTALAPVRSGLVQDIGLLLLALVVVVALGWYLAGRLSTTYSHLIEARLDADAARMEAERARQGAVFLAEASRELASSLDYEATLASVARLAVPDIADWCAVDVVDAGGNIRRLDVVHADPSKIELANDLARRYPTDPNASRAITDGRPQLIAEIPDVLLEAAATDQEHLRILRGLGLKSAMAVPLMARGRTLGALTFGVYVDGGEDGGHSWLRVEG